MESALIVSQSEKASAFFSEILYASSIRTVAIIPSCGEARRLLLEKNFDLIIINAPLRDESGEAFARHISAYGRSQVILVVRSEFYEAVAAICEADGVLAVAKPIHRSVFWAAVSLARSTHNRIQRMQSENTILKQKIEDIRVVARAKCILISYMGMNEQEAHRYIEKQAMDMRCTKKAVAEGILKTYES